MRWEVKALAGPMLWAVLFAAVYALHGAGCAWNWPAVETVFGSLHRTAMAAVWLTGLLLHAVIMAVVPKGQGRETYLCRMGAIIGLVASLITLAPIVVVSSCGSQL